MKTGTEASPPLLLLLAVAGFSSLAAMRLCDAMLPALAQAFAASTAEAAVVISSYALAYGAMQLVYGALGDRFGKPRTIAAGAACCAVATLAAALAPTLDTLVLARVAMGAGAAAIVPLALAWIGDTVPLQRRQEVLARYSGATVSGMMVGAWAGGLLTQAFGWRAAFFALAPFFAAVALRLWRQPQPARGEPLRQPYWQQLKHLVSPRWTRIVLATVFVEGLFAFGFIAFVPTVLHDRLALPLSYAGAVLAMFGIGGLTFSRIAGAVLRRVDPAVQARVGGTVLAAGYALLAWMPHWGWAAVGCALVGFGFYMLHNTLQVNATQLSTTSRGLGVSVFACSMFLGQSVGVPAAAWMFTHLPPHWGFAMASAALIGVGFAFGHQLQASSRLQSTG